METIISLIYFFSNSLLIGCFSFVWITIILDTNELGFIYELAESMVKKNILNKHLFKLFFNCFYCFSGQFSMWFYLFNYPIHKYEFFYHITFITLSILTTKILSKNYG